MKYHITPHAKEIFPVAIFYESDSRDNLEENTKKTDVLSSFISNSDHEHYLSGDMMFIQHIMDGDNKLGPLTDMGWNLYSEQPKSQMNEVSVNGLRTELECKFNRTFNDPLIKVPLDHIMFCMMHSETRAVEKLLNLEISRILSEANIASQTDSSISKDDLVRNLETQINMRGVR